MRMLALLVVGWGALLALPAFAASAPAEPAAEAAPATNGVPPAMQDNVRAFSPAELEILHDLEALKTELERREQALELREKLVDLMENRLTERVEEMKGLKVQLEQLTKELSGKEASELDQLAQIYGNMKPAAAAVVLNRLDNAIVFDVMKRMPAKKSGKLMEALDPPKARIISEMMAEQTVVPALGDEIPATP